MEKQKDGQPWTTVGVFSTHEKAVKKRKEYKERMDLDVKIKRRANGFHVKIRKKSARNVLANAPQGREA